MLSPLSLATQCYTHLLCASSFFLITTETSNGGSSLKKKLYFMNDDYMFKLGFRLLRQKKHIQFAYRSSTKRLLIVCFGTMHFF